MTSGPNVRLGTNRPSMTSHWMRSTPAFSRATTTSCPGSSGSPAADRASGGCRYRPHVAHDPVERGVLEAARQALASVLADRRGDRDAVGVAALAVVGGDR